MPLLRQRGHSGTSQQIQKYNFLYKLSPLLLLHRINNECVKNREARISIDLVKDEVENSLEREVENIKTYQQRMQKMLAKVGHNFLANNQLTLSLSC